MAGVVRPSRHVTRPCRVKRAMTAVGPSAPRNQHSHPLHPRTFRRINIVCRSRPCAPKSTLHGVCSSPIACPRSNSSERDRHREHDADRGEARDREERGAERLSDVALRWRPAVPGASADAPGRAPPWWRTAPRGFRVFRAPARRTARRRRSRCRRRRRSSARTAPRPRLRRASRGPDALCTVTCTTPITVPMNRPFHSSSQPSAGGADVPRPNSASTTRFDGDEHEPERPETPWCGRSC